MGTVIASASSPNDFDIEVTSGLSKLSDGFELDSYDDCPAPSSSPVRGDSGADRNHRNGSAPPFSQSRQRNDSGLTAETLAYMNAPALVPSGFAEWIWPGISMSDIARMTGLSLSSVSRIFNGQRKARRSTLQSIANVCTEGRIDDVEVVIRERVLKSLKYKKVQPDERNRILQRIGAIKG